MLKAAIIMIVATLAGCEKGDPRLMTPIDCDDEEAVDAFLEYLLENDISPDPVLEPPREFDGLWLDQFEGQLFVEDGKRISDFKLADVPDNADPSDFPRVLHETWIDLDRDLVPSSVAVRHGDFLGEIYHVKFTGRAAVEGQPLGCVGYGHGLSAQFVVVDKLHSISRIGDLGDRYPEMNDYWGAEERRGEWR